MGEISTKNAHVSLPYEDHLDLLDRSIKYGKIWDTLQEMETCALYKEKRRQFYYAGCYIPNPIPEIICTDENVLIFMRDTLDELNKDFEQKVKEAADQFISEYENNQRQKAAKAKKWWQFWK